MCDNCEEELITTSQGPQGEQGEQGEPGANGTNGVLDWNQFDLSCWYSEGITASEDNPVITQDFIDTFCEMYQQVNIAPVAVNDYRTINQDTIAYIEVINNDRYYPDVIVTIAVAPSNGTATIEPDGKTIKYIPNEGFIGIDDFDYTINDGDSTSTATVSVTIQEVITQQTIENTVLTQLQTLLSSDEYWDLSFAVGDKIAIRNETLTNFDFSNPLTAGIGQGRYAKWAICNGNNGTEDHTNNTLRGFNHTNPDYDESAEIGGSDSINLSIDNIPPHKHKGIATYIDYSSHDGDTSSANVTILTNAVTSLINSESQATTTKQLSASGWSGEDFDDAGAGSQPRFFVYNTGNGTDNIDNQKELKVSPDSIDTRNAYSVLILIQKIS